MKHLGINITKHAQELYTENCIALMQKVKDTPNK